MLDDFRNPIKDHPGDTNFEQNNPGSSQKKIAIVLTGLALILAGSLLFSGPSDSSKQDMPSDIESRLNALAQRIEALEGKGNKNSSYISLTTSDEVLQLPQNDQEPDVNNTQPDQTSTESLKELIARELASDTTQMSEPPATDEIPAPKKLIPAPKPQPQKAATPAKTYTVQKGDNLSLISKKMYGTTTRWKEIANANKGKVSSDNQVRVGTVLTIP